METTNDTGSRGDWLLIGGIVLALAVVNAVLFGTGRLVWGVEGAGIMVGAAVTLGIYSFLYRDNALFKVVEHAYVGIAAAYGVTLVWYNTVLPELVRPLIDGVWPVVARNSPPAVLGLLLLTRLSRRWGWLARYPFAFVLGLGAGYSIPIAVDALVLKQVQAAVIAPYLPELAWGEVVSRALLLAGTLGVLIYFFYSVEQKGVVGAASRVGIWFLMVSFGASFGYSVMARLSLLVGQLEFLLRDWLRLLE